MSAPEAIKQKVAALPESPGVYLFKDAAGTVIYIGKAKSLKKWVQSYFSRQLDGKTQVMVARIADVAHNRTASDIQAQILEAALIKQMQPHYNIELKDDKSFPWIKITRETFPQVSVCRRKKILPDPHATYLGPYTSAMLLRQALTCARKIFPFRTCRQMPRTPCMFFRVHLCPAPCAHLVARAAYRQTINRLTLFFESRHEDLSRELTEKMRQASQERRYEDAARLRDQITALGVFTMTPQVQPASSELDDLRRVARMNNLPFRIEGFDIANISGQEATGAMVSFSNGRPDKSQYRRFRIKEVPRVDDYSMLREVIRRRYARLQREQKAMPDLVLIDGGRGHLAAAQGVLAELALSIPLVSIAKGRENIYVSTSAHPLRLREGSRALNLIRRVRDEAHRFARVYHHLLRRKKIIGS